MIRRSCTAGPLLLALAAGCAGDEPATPAATAADAAPAPIEIAIERPVSPDGAGGIAGSSGGAPSAAGAEGFAALVPRLAVRDLSASVTFYRSLLGFEPVGAAAGGPGEAGGRALLARGPLRLSLEETPAEPGAAPSLASGEEPAIALVLSIADAASLFDRLADRARLVSGLRDTEWGTREFALADPDGHVVVLSQPL